MKKTTLTLLAALIILLAPGCAGQGLIAAKARPEPVIIIVE